MLSHVKKRGSWERIVFGTMLVAFSTLMAWCLSRPDFSVQFSTVPPPYDFYIAWSFVAGFGLVGLICLCFGIAGLFLPKGEPTPRKRLFGDLLFIVLGLLFFAIGYCDYCGASSQGCASDNLDNPFWLRPFATLKNLLNFVRPLLFMLLGLSAFAVGVHQIIAWVKRRLGEA